MHAPSELLIREYRAGDETEILATFERVFSAQDPGFVPRDLATWRWQFLENPGGWRIFVALTPEGKVVSQYAGIGQRVILEGAPARFSQSVDSMTDPAYRRGLKKPGLFVRTGIPYAERYGGPPPDRDSVTWGLPEHSAWRIGQRYLGYELVRSVNQLVADPRRVQEATQGELEIAEVRQAPADIGAVFERVAREHGAIAVRDAAQLDWRFLRHPSRRYRIATARSSQGLRGVAVYGSGRFDGARCGLVCDWLVPSGDPDAANALTAWLGACARSGEESRLVALFPDTSREWLDFQRAGFRVHPTRYLLAARCYHRPLDCDWLRRRWYFTLGDTDLV